MSLADSDTGNIRNQNVYSYTHCTYTYFIAPLATMSINIQPERLNSLYARNY